MDNGNDIDEGAVYTFTLSSGETQTKDKKVTANDGASKDEFGSRVAISRDTLLSGAYGKDGDRGAVPSMNLSLQEMDRGMKE